jgi:hypothetical protein
VTAEAAIRETEAQRVMFWRLAEFERLDVPYPAAMELALSEANLHDAQEMVKAGCTPELLIAILT